jgi:hypothetical protein
MLEAILSKYLLNALLLSLVSIFYSFLKNKLGEDRASTIKDAILAAMLWAEEELGIGNGEKKWEIAWKKLIEILADKNIKLRESEEDAVEAMMKANVGSINKQTYDILSMKKLLIDKGPSQQSLPTK